MAVSEAESPSNFYMTFKDTDFEEFLKHIFGEVEFEGALRHI